MSTCPMCAIAQGRPEAHKTEWFYHSSTATVVEDLNPKSYAIRLLGVPKKHFHCKATGSLIAETRLRVIEITLGIAQAICLERSLEVAKTDADEHSFADHWHFQACLRRA